MQAIGLKVDNILVSIKDKRKLLDKEEVLEKEPLLAKNILNGAGYFAECSTNDARLTMKILKIAFGDSAKITKKIKTM